MHCFSEKNAKNLKICQNFVGAEFFLTFVGDKPQWRDLKLFWGEQYLLLLFHYLIPLETANTQ